MNCPIGIYYSLLVMKKRLPPGTPIIHKSSRYPDGARLEWDLFAEIVPFFVIYHYVLLVVDEHGLFCPSDEDPFSHSER